MIEVKQYEPGMPMEPGVVYFAPAGGEPFYFYTATVSDTGNRRFWSADTVAELMAKVVLGGTDMRGARFP